MKSRDILEALYSCVYMCIEDITLPTGKDLLPSLQVCTGITCCTIICTAFDIYTFIDWRGAILATAILLVECIIERRNNSEISQYYSDAKLLLAKAKRGNKDAGSDESIKGVATTPNNCPEEDGLRSDGYVQDNMSGFDGSNGDSSGHEGDGIPIEYTKDDFSGGSRDIEADSL